MDKTMDSQPQQHAQNNGRKSPGNWIRNQFQMRPADDDEPQDWWFASTAIPLIAATTGPIANVFSIAALVSPWKNTIHHGQTDQDGLVLQTGLSDPRWCTAINATSLACGLIGNVFLLCNFTRVIRYIVALPASIILWFLATGLLVGVTASLHIYASPIGPDQTFSQSYWSAVIAAVLYFLLAILLMVNMLGYFLGHYPQHFALTDDQRTLILQTTAFMTWLAVGAAIFQQAMSIPYSVALYFCDLTILTLGFGDVVPMTTVSRGLVLPYAVLGIIILGLVVGSIHKFCQQLRYDNIVKKHVERKRQSTYERSSSFELRLKGSESNNQQNSNNSPNSMDGRPEILRQTSRISYTPRHRHRRRPIQSAITAVTRAAAGRTKMSAMKEEKERFDAMRAIQCETIRYRRWMNLVVSVIVFGIVWLVGAVIFWRLESITYFEALYFGFCSLLTIGYGDITPKSNAGRPFFVVWSLFAIPTMTILISEMSDTIILVFKKATDVFADWTLLPQSSKYRSCLQKFPRLFSFLQRREENKRVAQGFQVGIDDEEQGRNRNHHHKNNGNNNDSNHPTPSIGELARDPGPTNGQFAQQLVFAIRRTTKDALADEPRQYTYEEWVEFMRMIRFTDVRQVGVRLNEDEYGVINWDWIGETSPMVAEQTEPEWVLDRLCESLMRYLAMQQEQSRTPDGGDDGEEFTLSKERDIGLDEDG